MSLQCCVCVISLLGLKYCHNHVARVGSADDDDDADSNTADDHAAAAAPTGAADDGLEMGDAEGDKSKLIRNH